MKKIIFSLMSFAVIFVFAGVVSASASGWEYVEDLNIPSSTAVPTFSASLESGVVYRVTVSGTANAGDTIDFDAKYSITNRISGDTWTDEVSGYTSYGPTLLDLMVNGVSFDAGVYSAAHEYEAFFIGDGSALSFNIYDVYYPNNTGDLNVKIEKFVAYGEIIAPEANETVSGMFELRANYFDGDDADTDIAYWAVRAGSCNGADVFNWDIDGFGDWDNENFSIEIDTTGIADGQYCFVWNPNSSADDVRDTRIFFVDNTAPAMPTGLRRLSATDHSKVFECGDVVQIQSMHPDWDDNVEADFDYYEYTSFNAPYGNVGLDEKRFDDSIFEYNGGWLPGEGTYGFSVRAVDTAGNKSDWAISGKTLEGSCQITYDNTRPEIILVLPDGATYDGDVPFEAVCNEDCSYINFWWTKDGEAFDPADKQYHYVWQIGTLFEWTLDSMAPEYWKNDVRAPLDEGVYRVYAAGKDLAGNWARTLEHSFIIDRDRDDDGVWNEDDICSGTIADEFKKMSPIHYAWYEMNPFYMEPAKGKAAKANEKKEEYSIADTQGCSCIQILDWLNENYPEEYGELEGLRKHGCSSGIMKSFIDLSSL